MTAAHWQLFGSLIPHTLMKHFDTLDALHTYVKEKRMSRTSVDK
jgi:hypothetical protein